ncbi:hypothetical protein E1B28_007010 [Marasmius oreades]|uniref:Uncharacterized protein n=1 Tax=Marasmius oreades TaxID=181124 RepID=A0A9P7S117_9AGAR|nr:uncharacterized protein E1B28_007010 [Marasmius oreades]KAG7093330.1 hypothetical protein E1B28_007010 [Marasmius oreades]
MLDLPQYQTHHDLNVVDIDEKLKSTNLYHHPVQVIELVECTAPPRRIADYSYASSSYTSSDDDEELECSSYCSSEDPLEATSPHVLCDKQGVPQFSSDTYSLRMKRILSWRKNFSSHLGSTLSEPSLSSSLKRKISSYCGDDYGEDDVVSQSSKRSRSHSSEGSSSSSLGSVSCPACDTFFDDLQSLRQHGREAQAGANEACITAVDYAFE